METLDAAIEQVALRAREWARKWTEESQWLSEDDTKAVLIEPVLAALEWDVLDPAEVRRQYRHCSGDDPVDYALFVDSRPRLFLEAKALDRGLYPRFQVQALKYAAAAGVEWWVLTNGNDWRIYESSAPGGIKEKLKKACLIAPGESASRRDTAEVLSSISREQVSRRSRNA